MPITPAQKTAIEEVIVAILSVTAPRGKRHLAAIFMDLVDRAEWPEYYEIIPEPRCLKNIQTGVAKGRYKEATDVYTDLSLVFWNALFYNESGSQIALDAKTLKTLLETEWRKRLVLPATRSSPPPSSAQKVHGVVNDAEQEPKKEVPSTKATPAPPTPAAPPAAELPAPTAPAARIITPAPANSVVQPTASTSGSTDVEVDVVTPDSDEQESDAMAFQAERDPQSEEIVKQLEKGLPRFPGFGEEGWMADVNPDRYSDIVHALKTHKDIIGNRLAVCLESVPEESSPALHLSSTAPISLKQIEVRVHVHFKLMVTLLPFTQTRARHKMYKSAKDFDLDMARLFEKARRWHDPATEAYGRTLLLQRLYQDLTSPNPPAPPYISSTNFASLRAGPGNVKPVHRSDSEGVPNVTTYRVLTRDRTFVEDLNYKGWKIKVADWVHLANPDDPSRPIIGHVFKCWVSDEVEKKGQPGITVAWYYRPEQTFHPANKQFWGGEVFKTSHFADHPVEDIIEKIACQFTARHIRGRPRPPYWYVGFPLYVCDSRYNDRERTFVKLKNWNSCIPEEVRQSAEFMPIYPFERMVYPVRLPSPFLVRGAGKGAVKGPGGIISTPPDQQHQGDGPSGGDDGVGERGTASTKLNGPSARTIAPGTTASRYSSPYRQLHSTYSQQQQVSQRAAGPDRSVVSAAGGLTAIGGSGQVEKLPPETAKLFDRDPETNEVLWFAAPPLNMSRAKGPQHSLTYLQFLAAKRKRVSEGENDDEMECDDGDAAAAKTQHPTKRARVSVPPTVTETICQAWKELSPAEAASILSSFSS
ncbi:hypothetical protein CPB84DRAFT_1674763 [Gymnopilus junonius]|uniref:Uncharacterized protein n=1 Tax=Gymnopilus junonius TaxID=109634 RepID=A0A9P5TSG0_GYMJU|nr:hypothetical protein CPB84DRAFT_1674763 [Gymnopilus junonius]